MFVFLFVFVFVFVFVVVFVVFGFVVCLPVCLPACLPVCMPACLPACLCASLSALVCFALFAWLPLVSLVLFTLCCSALHACGLVFICACVRALCVCFLCVCFCSACCVRSSAWLLLFGCCSLAPSLARWSGRSVQREESCLFLAWACPFSWEKPMISAIKGRPEGQNKPSLLAKRANPSCPYEGHWSTNAIGEVGSWDLHQVRGRKTCLHSDRSQDFEARKLWGGDPVRKPPPKGAPPLFEGGI